MADDWINGDPFDSIVREFFGEPMRRTRRSYKEESFESEEEDRVSSFIETSDKIYLIFETPGYNLEDTSLDIKDKKIEVNLHKKDTEKVLPYLANKLKKGEVIKKTLPSSIDLRSMKFTNKHGVLEISFNKK